MTSSTLYNFETAYRTRRQGGHQFSHLDRLIISPVFISSTWKPTHWLPICSLDHLKMARGSAFQLTWREHILTKLEIETSKILAQRYSVVCARIMRVYAYCTQIRTSLTNLDRSKIWAVGRKKWFDEFADFMLFWVFDFLFFYEIAIKKLHWLFWFQSP